MQEKTKFVIFKHQRKKSGSATYAQSKGRTLQSQLNICLKNIS